MRKKIKYAVLGVTMTGLIYTAFMLQTIRSLRYEKRNQYN